MSPEEFVLLRRMGAHFVKALWVWAGVVGLATVAGMVPLPPVYKILTGLPDTRYALHTGLLRFGTLFWRCLLVLLVLELLIFVSAHFGLEPSLGAYYSRNLAIAFAGVALLFGVVSAVCMFKRQDPWKYLPGGPPFALREFARQHPQLHLRTEGLLGGTGVWVTNGPSSSVYFDESELETAVLSWGKCTDPAEVVRLGGPPPVPGTQCLARIQILREQRPSLYSAATDEGEEEKGEEENTNEDVPLPKERVIRYIYRGGRPTYSQMKEHFEAWAKGVGVETRIYGDTISFTSGGKAWIITNQGRIHGPWLDEISVQCAETLPGSEPPLRMSPRSH
jgi:hypothetical protein